MRGNGAIPETIFQRHGQTVCVINQGQMHQVYAFLQPIYDNRRRHSQFLPTEIGVLREDRFLYLGPKDVEITVSTQMVHQGQRFEVQSAHLIQNGREKSHWWAVLIPEEG